MGASATLLIAGAAGSPIFERFRPPSLPRPALENNYLIKYMRQGDLKFLDPERWLLGESPGWFVGEVVMRAVLIYVVLLLILRMLGKRTAGQMSITELAVVVTLGAAVGVP